MYTERFRSQTSAEIRFNASLEGSRTWQQVPERIAYEVYRIFQEQMGNINIIRHSGATRIEAALKLSDTVLSLTISNDGRAIAPTPSREGIGLTVMSERAKAIGAVISSSASGEMQVFRLDVPLPSSGQ